jgi:hypothetical protein
MVQETHQAKAQTDPHPFGPSPRCNVADRPLRTSGGCCNVAGDDLFLITTVTCSRTNPAGVVSDRYGGCSGQFGNLGCNM